MAKTQCQSRESSSSVVLVTGFGPFHHHTVNASWAAVQELQKIGVRDVDSVGVTLAIREIPVAYETVQQTVPKLLNELTPRLCIHVGVSPYNSVVLEKYGKNSEYLVSDIHGKRPKGQCCVPGGPECLQTKFNLHKIVDKVSRRQGDVEFVVSSDAGRYLCDFIYYTSLHVNSTPVLFVHVTELEKPYSVHQLAKALKNIIEVVLEEMGNFAARTA